MRDLQMYATKVMKMLDDINIPYRKPYSFTVNTRATTRWGQTRIRKGIPININISSILLSDDVSETQLIDTMAHELIHTCVGCGDHGDLWKAYAERFNKAYGYNICRTKRGDETAHQMMQEKKRDKAYELTCEKCGTKFYYQRWCKVTANPSQYVHSRCGGKLTLTKAKPGFQIWTISGNGYWNTL